MDDRTSDEFLSMLHHALRARRRRSVIELLEATSSPPRSVRWLARETAAKEQNVPIEQATGEPYRNVYNALSQTHLPSLVEAGIIIYDPDRQTVTAGPNLDTKGTSHLALLRCTAHLYRPGPTGPDKDP